MNKKTMIIIAIFVVLLVSFMVWNKFYSPNQWGRCQSNTDCAPREPKAGYYYFCENGTCAEKALVIRNIQCTADADCVAATCCHAKAAINKDYAPDCSGIFCTQECVPETLDCGQGEIKCVESACEAVLK